MLSKYQLQLYFRFNIHPYFRWKNTENKFPKLSSILTGINKYHAWSNYKQRNNASLNFNDPKIQADYNKGKHVHFDQVVLV